MSEFIGLELQGGGTLAVKREIVEHCTLLQQRLAEMSEEARSNAPNIPVPLSLEQVRSYSMVRSWHILEHALEAAEVLGDADMIRRMKRAIGNSRSS